MKNRSRIYLDISGRIVIILIDFYYMLGGAFLGIFFPYRKSLVYLAAALSALIALLRYGREVFRRREVIYNREILWIFFMFCTGLLCAFVTSEFTLVISVMCIFAFMNVNRGGLLQNLLLEKSGFLVISIVYSAMGIIPTESGSYKRLYSFCGDGIVYRRSLGFRNYNTLGLIVFELIILYVLYVKEKHGRSLKAGDYVFLTGIVFLCYAVSGSRTALIGSVLLLTVMVFSDLGWLKLRILKALITAALIGGCCIFSAGVVLLHDWSPVLYQKLDNILQARLRFVYRYMVKFGIKVFGNNTKDLTGFWGNEAGFDWISLDCGYAVMVIRYGVVVTALIVFAILIYLYGRQCSAKRYVLCIMLAVSIYNISENVLVFPTINFALLYLADVVSGSQKVQGTVKGAQESVQRRSRDEEQAVPWNR